MKGGMKLTAVALAGLVAGAQATTYFSETFDEDWEKRWVDSNFKKAEGTHGQLKRSHGEWFGDAEKAYGAQTSQDARFYASAAKFPTSFSNEGKDLVVQFSVKHEQKIDCGGGYLKVLPASADLEEFGGESPYYLMVGPDICGTSTKKVHFIFAHEGKNLLIKKDIKAETDQLTHVYTFVVRPDDTYQVLVDGEERASGKLTDDWDFTAAKTIKDPDAKKPSDWVDSPKMDDPEDVKPAGYDDIPAEIPDPDAEKPDDWDDEADGEWEAPTVPNPDYKGPWRAKQIDNPDYKGPWVHPEIPNPDYVEKTDLYKYDDFGAIGIDIWQVKSGTIFDSIIVTDSLEEAEAFAAEQFGDDDRAAEKKAFEAVEQKKKDEAEAARKKVEEEREKQDAAAEEDEEDDEEEDDEEEDDEEEDDTAGHDEL